MRNTMEILKEYAERSPTAIHGITDLFQAKSIKSKVVWTLALIGVVCFIPHNLISLLQDFRHAPTITFISRETFDSGYAFPLIRFCPRAWVNSSKLAESGLSRDAFLYALSLLYHVIVKANVTNVTDAALTLRYYRKSQGIRLRQVYRNIAYDVDELFECTGCDNMTSKLTILGICYDFSYPYYQPDETINQMGRNRLVYFPTTENHSDPDNANVLFSSTFASHVMYVDARTNDFIGFDPLYLDNNKTYEVSIKPILAQRMPGKGEKQCMDEASSNQSIDLCQLDCRESYYGSMCWGYLHYGLSIPVIRIRQNLTWHSSLESYPSDEGTIAECEEGLVDEVMKCMNSCYTACRQWQYDVQISETVRPWRPSPPRSGKISGASYWAWRRRLLADTTRYGGTSAISIWFHYQANYGTNVIEERNRQTPAAFISNVGGMMGLVAGASALSLWQLGECIIHVVFKRLCDYREQSYTLPEV